MSKTLFLLFYLVVEYIIIDKYKRKWEGADMGKIENIEKYITKCDEFIKDKLLFEEQEKMIFLWK